jgi:hypothetical protein
MTNSATASHPACDLQLKLIGNRPMIRTRQLVQVGTSIWRVHSRLPFRSPNSAHTPRIRSMSTFTKRMRMSNGPNAVPAATSGAADQDGQFDDGVHRTGATFAVPGAENLST